MSFNFARVLAWAINPERKPLDKAFSDDTDKEAAELVEHIEAPLHKRIAELETKTTRLAELEAENARLNDVLEAEGPLAKRVAELGAENARLKVLSKPKKKTGTKTSFNDLVQYINSGHDLDPAQVKQEREQLRNLLNEFGSKIQAGEGFDYELAGKIVVSVVDGMVDVSIVAGNGNSRAGDICTALIGLDGMPQGHMRSCEPCQNHFVSSKDTKKYCGDPCARSAWNKNLKEKKTGEGK